mmetsp:Transcript_12615/g.23657  ORF Transcript_12615/g.23657 Transcript_12615/m.23657 type:complete len:92 (+) Transcript_12615:275-550(+)
MISTSTVIMTVGEKQCAVATGQEKYAFSSFQSSQAGRFLTNLLLVQAKYCILEMSLGIKDCITNNSLSCVVTSTENSKIPQLASEAMPAIQ